MTNLSHQLFTRLHVVYQNSVVEGGSQSAFHELFANVPANIGKVWGPLFYQGLPHS